MLAKASAHVTIRRKPLGNNRGACSNHVVHPKGLGVYPWGIGIILTCKRVRSPIVGVCGKTHPIVMHRRIRLDEKLAVLQEADTLRKWHSLDDRRVCVLCDRVVTGRMIDVWQDSPGSYRMHCPTPGCPATPRDWFYHGPSSARPKVIKSERPILAYGASPA